MTFTFSRIAFIVLAIAGLLAVYLFQHADLAYWIIGTRDNPDLVFIINRALRLLINDLLMLCLLVAWFQNPGITRLAIAIQLIDFFILLPIYLYLKLSIEGNSEISSPLLSQFHRLIVNPTLMILLIPAIYFQRMIKNE